MLLLHAASICRAVQSKCRHSSSHILRLFKKPAQQAHENGCDSSAASFPPLQRLIWIGRARVIEWKWRVRRKHLGKKKKIDEGEKGKKYPKRYFWQLIYARFMICHGFMSLHCHGYRSDGGAVVLQNQNQQVQGASMNHLTPWICRLREQQG